MAMGGLMDRFGKLIPEQCCFECKDGGEDLRVCDQPNCLKSYHPYCTDRNGFPPPGVPFICNWHKCVDCRKSSNYYCLCCPNYSVCRNCLGKVEFFKLGKQSKGLCTLCFSLAISIEKDAAHPQAKRNYQEPDISELLFKDYWYIIKDRENLTLADLEASRCLWFHERGLNVPDEDHKSDQGLLGDCDNNERTFPSGFKRKSDNMKTPVMRRRSKGKTYVGWGTKELIEFLSCYGKDTKEPLDEAEVVGVVKEYIKEKGLLLGHKDKYFECDDKLHPLFTRRKVRYNMLHSKLRMHLASNAATEDESIDGSKANNGPIMKKKAEASLEPKIAMRVSERNKTCLASLNQHNINLIYLRRSLVSDLLKDQDTFGQKVVGSFVRVKTNTSTHIFHQKPRRPFLLGPVTGIKKSKEEYKIKDRYTDIILCVAGFWDDVKITMLSEENIEEDEFDDLTPLVEKGLLKRVTVAEFEEKVATVHTDIVNNWIDKRLQILEREIDLAHAKGWRQQMYELMEEKKLLSTPAERRRRLEEIPEIVADVEIVKETELEIAAGNSSQVKRGEKRDRPACLVDTAKNSKERAQAVADTFSVLEEKSSKGIAECASESFDVLKEKPPQAEFFEVLKEKAPQELTQPVGDTFDALMKEKSSKGVAECTYEFSEILKQKPQNGLSLVSNHISHSVIGRHYGIKYQRRRNKANLNMPGSATKSVSVPHMASQTEEERKSTEEALRKEVDNITATKAHSATEQAINTFNIPNEETSQVDLVDSLGVHQVAPEDVNHTERNKGKTIATDEVINTDERVDWGDPYFTERAWRHHLEAKRLATLHERFPCTTLWHYTDPQGITLGPFLLSKMREWLRDGRFSENLKVWRSGLTKKEAILLKDAFERYQ